MNFRCESGKRFDNKKVAYFYGDNVDKIIVFLSFSIASHNERFAIFCCAIYSSADLNHCKVT